MIWKQVALHFYNLTLFIMVLINTGTAGKLNRSTVPPLLFNKSSDFHTVFFPASHKCKRMGKNLCILLFSRTISNFQGQLYKIPGQMALRSSEGGNRSHNVSLPIILKKTKVGQILQYSCISLLVVPILLYWIQVSVSLNVLLYFGAEMATFCIKHIENRKIFF